MPVNFIISKAYWEKVKGNYTEKDFLKHYEKTGDMQGLVNGNLYFHNAGNIEDKVIRAIKEAGYTPEMRRKCPVQIPFAMGSTGLYDFQNREAGYGKLWFCLRQFSL